MRAIVLMLLLFAGAAAAEPVTDPAGFSFEVPEGFRTLPRDVPRLDSKAKYMYLKGSTRAPEVILGITLDPQPLPQEAQPSNPAAHETWNGFVIPTYAARASSGGVTSISRMCVVPLQPNSITVSMRCDVQHEAAGFQALRALLASVKGPTTWTQPVVPGGVPGPTPGQAPAQPANESNVGMFVVIVLVCILLGGLVYIFRDRIFKAPPAPAPPPVVVPPPGGAAPEFPKPPEGPPPPRNEAGAAPWEKSKGGTQIVSPEVPPWERGRK